MMPMLEWLSQKFYKDNHRKYHKYCDEWLNNLTESQLTYFNKQQYNIETMAMTQQIQQYEVGSIGGI